MTDVERNKAIARRTWEEIFPACDVDALAEVVDPDVAERDRRPDEPPGIEGIKRTMFWLATVFSEQRWEVHDVIGEGDLVVARMTHHGRHTGDLMGIPPTGREVAYQYVHFLRFRDGKAIEHWGVRDDMTLMRQLGVAPTPPSRPLVAAH
ncbi:MAG TPA: ester cyclase [Candidatus Limnocylindrales bacterium]|jgi:predicted ester cyclase|nr:ester cyclase [Candidatus Limnocylindrales bacterium]